MAKSKVYWLIIITIAGFACGDDDSPSDASFDGAPPADTGTFDAADAADPDAAPDSDAGPELIVQLPRTGISASEVAILVNDDDPQSVALADAYQRARGISSANIVRFRFATGGATMTEEDFGPLYDQMMSQLGADVQALAITWTRPYRVACMSITSAFALGFDRQFCNTSGETCGATARVDYFDSDSTRPFTDHGIRPAVMLAAANEVQGLALIERGVAGDDTLPAGDGFLVRTTDAARSVRSPTFQRVADQWAAGGLRFTYIDNSDGSGSNSVEATPDVLFYFTGLARVPNLASNTYLPGALADHLTSHGGSVPTSSQMSVVEWLEGGVTGSYGTVVEPCNFTTKFPSVPVLIERYFRGETLLEAYWKSVATPGEGLFVGEPLSRPFGTQQWRLEDEVIIIETNAVVPTEQWEVQWATTDAGPWTMALQPVATEWQRQTIRVPLVDSASVYRLVRTGT